MTFSINIGTDTESSNLELSSIYPDMDNVLERLPDNLEKLISPDIIRDSIFTIWSNTGFKSTKTSNNYPYIGLDSGNPLDRNVSDKIFIGKRSFSATQSYQDLHDIMNDTLLNSDVDIFLYNTKRDSINQNTTRVVLLAGTNSSNFVRSPFIQSQVIPNNRATLDIINPTQTSGSLNILGSTVSINDVVFPEIQSSQDIDGKILKYDTTENSFKWDFLSSDLDGVLGTSSENLPIFGSPVNINGYSLELDDNRPIVITFSDVNVGTKFNNESIVEVLRRMVYDYLKPKCSIKILPPHNLGYVEIFSSPFIQLEYTIFKRSLPTQQTSLSNMIPSFYESINDFGYKTVKGIAQGVIIPNPIGFAPSVFTITVTDQDGGSESASASITGIYPFFIGQSLKTVPNFSYRSIVSDLSKIIENTGDKEVNFDGGGYLYFMYDSNYGELSSIDNNGTNIISDFVQSVELVSSSTSRWAAKEYIIYRSNLIISEPIKLKFLF
jgi:hypothetical protein